MSYTVQCNICYASGPHVIIEKRDPRHVNEWHHSEKKAQAEAIEKWNELRIDLRDEELNRIAKEIKL